MESKELQKQLEGLGAMTSIGHYLAGLPDITESPKEIYCAEQGDDFVFLEFSQETQSVIGRTYIPSLFARDRIVSSSYIPHGPVLGKIPRDSINEVIVDDRSQIAQRLTVTRMLTLGIFSLAAPKAKKHKNFCLVIDWDDDNGTRQNTVFEFKGWSSNASANLAAQFLRERSRPKVERLKPSERKCPYCAEIIKREAKICRFCRSELIG